LLIIFIPISFAKEVSIPELFTVTKESTSVGVPGKEVYFYVGSNLIASLDNELKYQYQNRLNSDGESKSLPFGQPILTNNRFSFTGKELDQDLYYFYARYYDPELGRFTSVDPVEENHPYSYVENNPMNLIDPTGMDEERRKVTSGYFMPYDTNAAYPDQINAEVSSDINNLNLVEKVDLMGGVYVGKSI